MSTPAQTAQQADFIRSTKAAVPDCAASPAAASEFRPAVPAPRNLVVCCDGTGNTFGTRNTNVVRLYGYLVKDQTQLTYYDPGVGTLSPPSVLTKIGRSAFQLWGLAFGQGITGDIEDAYKFLMDNYKPGDRVFLFGFSRGAYTVRALAGMIHRCGLLPKGSDNLIRYVTKMYLDGEPKLQEDFKQFFSPGNECKPHFVGVWDTVTSVSFFRPMVFSDARLNPDVRHGRQALAMHERRGMYEPFLWAPANATGQALKQLWFTGVHSDVGGGYPDRGLADNSLDWMAQEAHDQGLNLLPGWKQDLRPAPRGATHNPLLPFWWALPFHRRAIGRGAEFHPSVAARHADPAAHPAYVTSVTRPVGLLEWVAGGVPSFALLAAIGFCIPLLWWGLTVGLDGVAGAIGPVMGDVWQWLRGLNWAGQGGVGAAVMVAVGFVVWGIRHWNTRTERPQPGWPPLLPPGRKG